VLTVTHVYVDVCSTLKLDFFYAAAGAVSTIVLCTSLHVTSHFHSSVTFFLRISCFSVFMTRENN